MPIPTEHKSGKMQIRLPPNRTMSVHLGLTGFPDDSWVDTIPSVDKRRFNQTFTIYIYHFISEFL